MHGQRIVGLDQGESDGKRQRLLPTQPSGHGVTQLVNPDVKSLKKESERALTHQPRKPEK